ncbi:MAG: hypothetical protein IPH95_11690 [Candidatus Promineofilum sp.]|nr:hypothetical protein [Promineifilum sp.]
MAFAYANSKGTTYYLHGREVGLNNDHQRTIYFFAKDAREGVLDQVPEGWQVMEGRNALPVLSENGKMAAAEPQAAKPSTVRTAARAAAAPVAAAAAWAAAARAN